MPTFRPLGDTDIHVTPVAMGCWPIAGITSVGVTREDSLATLRAAFDSGINFFDTAYVYGYAGESERMVGEVLGPHRDDVVIATKAGLIWEDGPPNTKRPQRRDARPETIHAQARESLDRLGMDVIDLYYLHAPDPDVPIRETAGAFAELLSAGTVRSVGVSNYTLSQLQEFLTVCPVAAVQPHFNMLQQEISADLLPFCVEHSISLCVYWPLMKGFLAGKLTRDHTWDPQDGRQKYPMFQGAEWQKNHDFLDELQAIADDIGRPVADVVTNWTIHQPGITVALCGAKRPEQIEQTAEALHWKLSDADMQRIGAAIERRGPIATRGAV